MTISNVTVGAAAVGNNASVVPGLPAGGLLVNDLVLIFAAIRNNPAGSVNTPAGWTKVAQNENTAILGRFWQTGDTMPTVTFAGGVANADTYAMALKARGVATDALVGSTSNTGLNASAQNITTPSLAVPGNDHLLAMFVWKQDDATSLTTPAGWSAQGLTNMTLGDDQLAAVFTQQQTTDTDIAAGAITVTGGVAAIGRSIILALAPAPLITATEVDLFPPRMLVSVTGLTLGDSVQLYREVGGQRTEVRSGYAAAVTDPSFLRADAELPFDVPVRYVAVVNSTAEYYTPAVSHALPGGKAVLTDAITGESSTLVVTSWPSKKYERQASVFKVGGRNVVITGDIGMFEATLEVFFEAYSSTENFFALLESATEGVLQLRAPLSTYEGVDCYVVVLGATEKRFSQDGSDGRRTWDIEVAEVEGWSPLLEAKAFTLQDVANKYLTPLTIGSYGADFATMLLAAQADLS